MLRSVMRTFSSSEASFTPKASVWSQVACSIHSTRDPPSSSHLVSLQALWNFCIDSPSSMEAFGAEEASELEKVLITLLDMDLDEEDNNGVDEVSVWDIHANLYAV